MLFLAKVVDPLRRCTSLNAAHLCRMVQQVGGSGGLVGLAAVDLGLRGVGCHHFADLVLFMFQQLLFLINYSPLPIIHCQSATSSQQRPLLTVLQIVVAPKLVVSLLFLRCSLSSHTLTPILTTRRRRQHETLLGRFRLKDLAQEILGLILPILLLLRLLFF